METIKVGILGSGDVAKSLAKGFISLGHQVKLGSRSPEKLHDFVADTGERASAGTFEEAARFGDFIALATLGAATLQAIDLAGTANFDGKVVIDATNPLRFEPGKPPTLYTAGNDSLGEQVQRHIPKARVVKAFNTVGNGYFVNPKLEGGPPDMFVCGNDGEAKKLVSQVCKHFGWGVIDLGGIESSRYTEAMCVTWVLHGILSGSWNHAFKMLHG